MKYLKLYFLFLICIFCNNINAQNHHIKGIVTDEVSKERLAFVNIIINDNGTLGTTTDIDGYFSIKSKNKINSLTFSFVGYEKKKIEISNEEEIFVSLKPQFIELSEVVIDATKNPANRIIDSVLKYREHNNPKSLDSYYYKIYDNMTFTIDTVNLNDDELLKEFKNNDLMAMETVSEQFYKKPNKNKKNILANKISGLKDSRFVYILENIQSIGFQEDFISIDNKKYINPISRGSKNKYIFVLEESIKNDSNDSIFIISFKPYKNSNFNGLSGSMTINSDSWAIQNIKAEPSEENAVFNISIQQLYEKENGVWFPKQLNTNIIFPFPDGNLLGIGKSYISEIEINKDIDNKIFDNADYSFDENVNNPDDVIKAYRYEAISGERLEATYKYVDSVFNYNNINLDKITKTLSSLMNSEVAIGFVNLNINNIIDYNIGNGFMIGLDLSTNKKISKIFSLGGFGNYWTKANEFNYGGNLNFKLLASKNMRLNLSAEHKFERLGQYGFSEKNNILDESAYKHFFVKATSLNNIISAEYSTFINKNLKGFLKFQAGDKIYGKTYRLSSLDFKLKISFKEKYVRNADGLRAKNLSNPTVWLSYQKNLKGVFNSEYNFDKIQFDFEGYKDFRYFGRSHVKLQAGYISGLSPVTELFNIEGTTIDKFNIYCTETFNTMRPDEFFCDKFAALYLSHRFSNFLRSNRKIKPDLMLVTNIAWGELNRNNHDTGINDISKGYYESGLIIDRLLDIIYCNYGLGFFYRYGPYSFDNVWDNFAFKLNISFGI